MRVEPTCDVLFNIKEPFVGWNYDALAEVFPGDVPRVGLAHAIASVVVIEEGDENGNVGFGESREAEAE